MHLKGARVRFRKGHTLQVLFLGKTCFYTSESSVNA